MRWTLISISLKFFFACPSESGPLSYNKNFLNIYDLHLSSKRTLDTFLYDGPSSKKLI